MENDMYEISPRSGRLRRKIKFKKHKPKRSLKSKISRFIQHPFFIFTIVAITGVILYYSLQEPGKKSRKRPSATSVMVNKKIKDERTQDE